MKNKVNILKHNVASKLGFLAKKTIFYLANKQSSFKYTGSSNTPKKLSFVF